MSRADAAALPRHGHDEHMEPSASDNERREWTNRNPGGVRYRVVIAPRGTWLRGGSAATDLATAVVELVVSAIRSSTRYDGTWKVGVLKTKWGVERFVHRTTVATHDAAVAEAERLRRCVGNGDFGRL
jgi:hypothetical protein